MIYDNLIKQEKLIKRNVIGIVIIVALIFISLIGFLQYIYSENNYQNKLLNEYHLGISKKSIKLLGLINSIKIWFIENQINNTDTHSRYSLNDKITSLHYEIETTTKKIFELQKRFPLPEFSGITEILKGAQQQSHIKLDELKLLKNVSSSDLSAALSPLVSVNNQLFRLHDIARQQKISNLNSSKRTDLVETIILVSLLFIIGILSVFKLLGHVRKSFSEQKNQLQKLEASEMRFTNIAQATPVGVFQTDIEGACIFTNQRWQEIAGLDSSSALGDGWSKAIHPDDRDSVFEEWGSAIEENRKFTIECRMQRPDGAISWVYAESFAEKDNKGNIVSYVGAMTDITDIKQSEIDLLNASALNDSIISNSPIGIGIYASNGDCISANKSIAEMIGATHEQILAQNYNNIGSWKESGLLQTAQEALSKNQPQQLEVYLTTTFGKEVYFDFRAIPIQHKNSTNLLLMVDDITSRKLAESAVVESEKRLNEAQKIASVGHWKLDTLNNKVEGSDELFKIFGLTREEATLDAFVEVVHPDDREMDVAAIQRGAELGESWDIEHRLVCRDGTEKWVHAIGKAVCDDTGKVCELIGTVQDITKLKKTELALVDSELWLKNTFNALDEAVLVVDPNRNIMSVNSTASRMFEYSEQEIKNSSTELFHVDHQHYVDFGERISESFSKNQTANFEFEAKRKSGEIFPTEHTVSLLKSTEGEVKGIVSVVRDITERKRVEQSLVESESNLRALAENATDGILVGVDGQQVFANPAIATMLGYSIEELTQMRMEEVIHPDEVQRVVGRYKARQAGDDVPAVYETIFVDKSGNSIPVELTPAKTRWNGKAAGLAYVRDLREKHESERLLKEAQHIASIGSWSWDAVTNELKWSDEVYRMFGLDPLSFDANLESFMQVVHPDDRPKLTAAIDTAIKNPDYKYKIEHRFITASGDERIAQERGKVHRDKQGVAISMVGTVQDITDRKNAEQKLISQSRVIEQSRAQFEAMFESIPDSVIYADPDRKIRLINSAAIHLFGFSDAELIGNQTSMLYASSEDFAKQGQKRFNANANAGVNSAPYEITYKCKNGREFQGETIGVPVKSSNGEILGFLGIIRDITERKKAEQAIIESEARLNKAQQIANMGSWEWNMVNNTVSMSEQAQKILEKSETDFSHGNMLEVWLQTIHPDDRDRVEKYLEQSMCDLSTYEDEYRIITESIQVKHLYAKGEFLLDNNGAPVALIGSVMDVTKRKKMEEQLLITRNAVETSMDGLVIGNMAGNVEYCNQAFVDMLGYRSIDLIKNISAHKFWQHTKEDETHVEHQVKATGRWVGEVIAHKQDGSTFPARLATTLTKNEYGEPVFLAGSLSDISEQKNAEKELAKQQLILEKLVDNLPGMIYQCRNDKNWTLEFTNAGCYELTGYKIENFLKGEMHYADLIHPDDAKAVWGEVQLAIDKSKSFTVEYRILNADNEVRWVWERGQGFFDQSGELEFIQGFITDVTERKNAEHELANYRQNLEELVATRTDELKQTQNALIKKERLATLGQLTATVSHELRNPLGAMRPSLYIINKTSVSKDERLTEAIERIDRNISRCDRIIDELLDFTRITDLNLQELNIDKWLDDLIDEQNLPEEVVLEKDLNSGDQLAQFDSGRLARAVINLLDNACQSMADETNENIYKDKSQIKISTRLTGKNIKISFQDSGNGIPADEMSKVFEPLYSTKGFGVGLGLSAVKQIIEQHRGSIKIDSKVDCGTTVTLVIPYNQKSEIAA